MLKFFKNTIVRVFLAVAFLVIAILSYAFWENIVTQFNHVVAYYHVYVGDENFQKGKLQNAIDSYNHALKLYPEHVKARYNLGNIYVAYEDYDSAILCYEQALNYSPNYINARIHLGMVLAEKVLDFDRAIDQYTKAAEANPFIINIPFFFNNKPYVISGKAVAYYNLGLAYKYKSLWYGDESIHSRTYLRKSAESYKNSLRFDPFKYDTHYNLALTYHLLSNFTEAKEEYCKAINLEPLSYEAHYNLALLLKEKADYKASIEELEKAGLLLDSRGDGYKTRYIYNVLNEVSQKAAIQGEYKHLVEKINDEPSKYSNITYLNGKVVITEELDKAMIENMRNCSSCKISK